MLTNEQMDILADGIRPLFQYLEREVTVDVARRIKKTMTYTRTAELMAIEMRKLGFSPAKIRADALKLLQSDKAYCDIVEQNTIEYKKEVARLIDDIVAEAKKAGDHIIGNASKMSWIDDMSIWESAGKQLGSDSFIVQLQDAVLKQTMGEIANITRTSGFKTMSGFEPLQDLYRRELDKAVIKLCTGTFSQEKVVRDVVKDLAHSGLRSIDYSTGRSMYVDTAVKNAIRTGCNQLSARIHDANIVSTGENLVYVTAHIGARNKGIGIANHQNWQGKVYYIRHTKSYKNEAERIGQTDIEDIWEKTGYSPDGSHPNNPLGLHGYNCRHLHMVWFEGLSSKPVEAPEPPPIKYRGRMFDFYACTQKMRRMERDIRALKREIIASQKLHMPTEQLKGSLMEAVEEYGRFCERAGVPAKTTNLSIESETIDISKTKAWRRMERLAE